MSFPPRPKRAAAERADPEFSGSRNSPAANGGFSPEPRGEAAAPLRFPGDRRREESEMPRLSAGERLAVSSAITGGDGAPRRGFLRSLAFAALCILAVVGAVSIYHSLAGAFPH